jgi:hypothetical protein
VSTNFESGAIAEVDSFEPDPKWWLTMAVTAIAQLLIVLDATVVTLALPSMQKALHISAADRSWALTAYTLAFGGLILLGGRNADYVGRKRAFILGLLGFAAASALGGSAPGNILDGATPRHARNLRASVDGELACAGTLRGRHPHDRRGRPIPRGVPVDSVWPHANRGCVETQGVGRGKSVRSKTPAVRTDCPRSRSQGRISNTASISPDTGHALLLWQGLAIRRMRTRWEVDSNGQVSVRRRRKG